MDALGSGSGNIEERKGEVPMGEEVQSLEV